MRAIARARIVALTIATGVGVALTLTGVVNPAAADTAPPVAGTPVTASADALPAPQINGVVWAQAIAGNIAYAGGEFTTARPAGSAPGTNEVPRNNLLAYNLTTGELIASFNPGPNARVKSLAVTPDGTKLFVGGTFTTIGGATRYRLAAFDTATGALLPWAPSLNASVYAMAVTNSTVYIGGPFSSANQQTRNHLAAYSTTSATLLPWAPSTVDGSVAAMTVKPDGSQVVIGGSFTTLNGSSNPGMGLASVDGITGALLPWAVNNVVRNAGEKGGIFALAQDGTSVYGTGWMYSQSAGTLEGTFKASWDGGALNWVEDCHGDTYGVAPTAEVVYTAGHAHYCGNTPGGFPQTSPNWTFYRAIGFTQTVQGVAKRDPLGYHNWEGTPAPALLNWYPDINTGTYTGINQGAWNVITDGRYLLYGGEFTEVNGTPQQGLVRFALPGVGEKKSGPVYSGARSVPAVNVLASDAARITWTANYDYDNESLAYELLRDNVVVYSATQLSKPWLRPSMGYFDADVAPGTTYKYRLRATDPDGNVSLSDAVVVTTGTGPGLSAYQRAVVSDASNYWTLNEAAGTTVADSAGVEHAVATSTVQRGTEPAIFGDTTGFSARFTPSSYAATQVVEPTSNTFSAEGWFKTNTTRGGKLFGFGNKLTGNSSSYDRHVYMTNNGRLAFGVYNGATSTVLTSQQYNDNQWHHVVATLGPSGMALYVDGVLRASNTTTAGQAYNGVFRIGGDNLSGWPSRPSNDYFTGNIDDVALYGTVLSASQVQNHYLIGTTGVGINVAPTAAFTSTANGLNFDFDGTGSTDSDGTIVSYAWDFGDGASATGSTTTHTYAEAGTYTVSLTVTDNRGATHTTTQSVTAIRPPNAAPTAAFASSSVDLELSVDGSGSSDSDGSVTDYAWDFGDGSTGTGVTASHTYAAAGTYTVTLTVTDNEGATGTLAKSVAVLAPNQAPTASFTVTGSNLAASVDGSASTDTDGTISLYTWAWGDGATGVGATATHTYAAAGTYTITLTVTDNRGGTAATTRQVTLVQTVYAQDDFARTTTGNWGTATIGGTWTGSNIGLSTNGNTGNIALKIGQTLTTTLNTVSTTNLDLSVKFAVTQPITGSGVYVSAIGRQVGTDNYTVRTRIYPTGVVNLQLQRSGVTIAAADVPGMTYTTGQQLNLRVQVFGTSPTTLRAIVWAVGAAEPNTWLVSTTDSTAALQTAGFVGLAGYLGGSATSPVSLAFDDFVARPAN